MHMQRAMGCGYCECAATSSCLGAEECVDEVVSEQKMFLGSRINVQQRILKGKCVNTTTTMSELHFATVSFSSYCFVFNHMCLFLKVEEFRYN